MSSSVGQGKVTFTWSSALPYAKIHNWGGPFLAFGKYQATMPKRMYGYLSPEAIKDIAAYIIRDIKALRK